MGWEIDIDQHTLNRYNQVNGDFGNKLKKNICDGHFALCPGDRCPFLNPQNLCEIYQHLGEEALCQICAEHPRFVEVYGDIMEKGVGLCCEEAVKLVLENEPRWITTEIDEEPDEINDEIRAARDAILEEREQLFSILAMRNLPLRERLLKLLNFVEETQGAAPMEQEEIPKDKLLWEWVKVLGEGESYGPAWTNAFNRIVKKTALEKKIEQQNTCREKLFTDTDGERIISYLLFRYYGKCLFDGDNLSKIQFVLFFWITLQNFAYELAETISATPTEKASAKINAIKLLSKQVEYSEAYMELLNHHFFEDDAFSLKNIGKLL